MSDPYEYDASFVAVLRAVIVMLHVDGKIEAEEEKWFRHVLKICTLPEVVERQLLEELYNPGSIAEILLHIRHPDDRRELLALADLAMKIDGKIDEREQELYAQFSNLKELKLNYADELVNHTNRALVWERLKEAGRFLRRRARRGIFGIIRFPKE